MTSSTTTDRTTRSRTTSITTNRTIPTRQSYVNIPDSISSTDDPNLPSESDDPDSAAATLLLYNQLNENIQNVALNETTYNEIFNNNDIIAAFQDFRIII